MPQHSQPARVVVEIFDSPVYASTRSALSGRGDGHRDNGGWQRRTRRGPSSITRLLGMSDTTAEELKELLKTAARAHHEATGGTNAAWAEWYAEHMHDPIRPLLGMNPSVEELAGWLTATDIEYRAEEHDVSWPRYYARFIRSRTAGR